MKNPCRLLFSSFSLFLSLSSLLCLPSPPSPRATAGTVSSLTYMCKDIVSFPIQYVATHTHTQTTQPNNSNKFSLNLAPLKNYLAYSREESKCKYCTLDDWCSLTFVNNLNYKLIQWEKPENFSIPNINKFISELNRLLV